MSDHGSTPPPPDPYGQQPTGAPGQPSAQGAPPPAPSYDGGAYGAPAPSYQSGPPTAPVAQPPSIATAVKLMYVGAVLGLIGALSTIFQRDALREMVAEQSADTGTPLDAGGLDAAVAVGLASAVIFGIIGALLWVFMAIMNGKGRKWARIVATVFFGISVLGLLSSFAQPTQALSLTLSVISVLLGGYIIFLLFRPESTQFYNAQSAPRY